MCLDGFCDCSDLVDLQEQGVASLLVNGHLDTLGVGDGQVVANDLNGGGSGQSCPSCPIILNEEMKVLFILFRIEREVLSSFVNLKV